MSNSRYIPAGLIALGTQKISLSGTAVYTLNSTCDGADVVIMSVETANVRARFDGTNPAASTGVLYTAALAPYRLELAAASSFKITAVSGSPVAQVAAFKYAGTVAH
jgi:hypothetical protein